MLCCLNALEHEPCKLPSSLPMILSLRHEVTEHPCLTPFLHYRRQGKPPISLSPSIAPSYKQHFIHSPSVLAFSAKSYPSAVANSGRTHGIHDYPLPSYRSRFLCGFINSVEIGLQWDLGREKYDMFCVLWPHPCSWRAAYNLVKGMRYRRLVRTLVCTQGLSEYDFHGGRLDLMHLGYGCITTLRLADYYSVLCAVLGYV